MSHFVIVKNGIARIMHARDGVDPASAVAKWHPADQAQVTSIRPIDPADIPADRDVFLRDGWEDDGTKITVNMDRARPAFETHLRNMKLAEAFELIKRETAGEDVTAEKAALQAMRPDVAKATDAAALKALWPSGLRR